MELFGFEKPHFMKLLRELELPADMKEIVPVTICSELFRISEHFWSIPTAFQVRLFGQAAIMAGDNVRLLDLFYCRSPFDIF